MLGQWPRPAAPGHTQRLSESASLLRSATTPGRALSPQQSPWGALRHGTHGSVRLSHWDAPPGLRVLPHQTALLRPDNAAVQELTPPRVSAPGFPSSSIKRPFPHKQQMFENDISHTVEPLRLENKRKRSSAGLSKAGLCLTRFRVPTAQLGLAQSSC